MPEKNSEDNPVLLGKGSKITISIVSIICAVMLSTGIIDPPRPEIRVFYWFPPIFCLLIAAACLLPRRISGYCGDVIALTVLVFMIWALFQDNSETRVTGPAPILVFPIAYLYVRYEKIVRKWATKNQKKSEQG